MANEIASTSTIPFDGGLLKRKRTRSRSPGADAHLSNRRRSNSPQVRLELPRVSDVDPVRKAEREKQLAARMAASELEKNGDKPVGKAKQDEENKAEFAKLLASRSGGVYVPPARLRALQAAAGNDKNSPEYQRLAWDALRKSITGIVNRVNIINIKQIVPELFSENLIRGRGLFARSVMKAQAASLPFTPVFAALVSIINTKLPQVGELVLIRLISQFRRSFKRNDKIVCQSSSSFIAHLVNQLVAHHIIVLEILILLLERPTDDSIEIAVGLTREVGAFLAENASRPNATIFERFRAVLNEGAISQRVQYMIEVLMQVRKDKYKDNPIIPEGLDLVDEEDQITHQIQLEEDLQIQEGLNIFKFDPHYQDNEDKYKAIKAEILGEDGDDDDSGSEESGDDGDDEVVAEKEGIEDRTETNLVNLRRIIYLTIMNALNYEEAVHKLLKVQIAEGQEIEMINMIIECCSQERSYSTFYGLVGERFSKLNRVWTDCFEEAFRNYYETIHRYETNRLRNISRFFGHLLGSDSISWAVFECVKINEEDTTSSSRIFIKILMTEMMESMGLKALADRFKDEEVKRSCKDMFPMDNPKNTRFSINYFTSIGLGAVTEEMREYLKNAPRLIMEQRRAMLEASSSSDSDSDSDSDDSDDSDTDSDSDDSPADSEPSDVSDDSRRRRRRAPSPPRRRDEDRDRDRDLPRNATRHVSRSPPPRRRSLQSVSPVPPPRHRDDRISDREKGRDVERNRDSRRYQSPPHMRTDRDASRDHGYRRRGDRSPARSPPPRRRSPPPAPHTNGSGRDRNGRDDGYKSKGRDDLREQDEFGREKERDGYPRDGHREKDRARSPPPRRDDSRRYRDNRDYDKDRR